MEVNLFDIERELRGIRMESHLREACRVCQACRENAAKTAPGEKIPQKHAAVCTAKHVWAQVASLIDEWDRADSYR